MRLVLVAMLALCESATAQVRVGIRAGGAAMTPLVRDSIGSPIAVRSDAAPTIGFWLQAEVAPATTVSAEFGTTWGHLSRREPGVTTRIAPLTTWTPAARVSFGIAPAIHLYAKAGAIVYRADRIASNLFRSGVSPKPLIGGGVTWERPLAGGVVLVADAGYDVHRFSTPALLAAGFRGERAVHRFQLSLGVSRGWGLPR